MYGVELYAAVRLAVVDEGVSHHEAGRRFGIDRRTVKKMLSYAAPPGYRRTKPVRRPKLDGFGSAARSRTLSPPPTAGAPAVEPMSDSEWRGARTDNAESWKGIKGYFRTEQEIKSFMVLLGPQR